MKKYIFNNSDDVEGLVTYFKTFCHNPRYQVICTGWCDAIILDNQLDIVLCEGVGLITPHFCVTVSNPNGGYESILLDTMKENHTFSLWVDSKTKVLHLFTPSDGKQATFCIRSFDNINPMKFVPKG